MLAWLNDETEWEFRMSRRGIRGMGWGLALCAAFYLFCLFEVAGLWPKSYAITGALFYGLGAAAIGSLSALCFVVTRQSH